MVILAEEYQEVDMDNDGKIKSFTLLDPKAFVMTTGIERTRQIKLTSLDDAWEPEVRNFVPDEIIRADRGPMRVEFID